MLADSTKVLRMLKTARGQLDGLIRMVEANRYCMDISNQLLATEALLKRINRDVLHAHLSHCVAHALSSNDPKEAEQKVGEVIQLIDKLTR